MACQESAGGILACLSEHAGLGVSGSHSFTLSLFLPTSVKRFGRREEKKKKHGERGCRTRDECVWSYSRETGCVFVCVAEGGVVPCPVQH